MSEFTNWWTRLSWSDGAAIILGLALVAWGVACTAMMYRKFAREMDRRDLAARTRQDQPPAFTTKKRY